jgi:hypothetical protein
MPSDRRTAYYFEGGEESSYPAAFRGGDQEDYIRGYIENALFLREQFTQHKETDAGLKLAGRYGVTEDLFVKPVAVFTPKQIPVKGIGKSIPTVNLVEHGIGMSLSGIPDIVAKKHRVYLYQALIPERLGELPNINKKSPVWDRIREAVEKLPGEELKNLRTELKIAFRAAAGYAAVNRLVHNFLGGACQTGGGGTFQQYGHNVNPLVVFDYDTIWKADEEEGLGLKRTKEQCQERDGKDAKERLKELFELLNLKEDEKQQANQLYDKIYNA